MRTNGISRKSKSEKKQGRANGCIDWYLITTYYYPGGQTRTTEQYLYTTCNGCQEEAYRTGKVACGGGGGSGGGTGGSAVLPVNPQDGDEYAFTSREGEYTRYKYNAASNVWAVVERILPPMVVEYEPENYSFLQIQWPMHGLVIFGSDNMTYTYDGGSGAWHGIRTITNNVTNPCISQQVNNAISESMTNEINTLIKNVFDVNDQINLTVDQVTYLDASVDAITDGYTTPSGALNIDISFNGNVMPLASQEYIMATLYHEFLHAILFHNGIEGGDHHESIVSGYLNILANDLIVHFPNLSQGEAMQLAWGGLQETSNWSSLSASEQASILATNTAHRDGQNGTNCN